MKLKRMSFQPVREIFHKVKIKGFKNNNKTDEKGTNSKSIKTRMILLLGILIFAVCTGLGMISYEVSSKALIDNTNRILPQMAKEAAVLIEKQINTTFKVLDVTAKNINDEKYNTTEKLAKMKDQQIRGGYLLLGIADHAGTLVTADNKYIDIKNLEYYQRAMNGESVVSEPIPDTFSDNNYSLVVVFAIPIKTDGQVKSILFAIKNGNEFNDLTNAINFGESGRAFMVNATGDIISHTNVAWVIQKRNFIKEAEDNTSYKQLANTITQMTTGSTGVGEYNLDGVVKYAGYAPIKGTNWSIAVTSEKSELLSGLKTLGNASILFTVVFVLIGVVAVFIIASNITSSLRAMVKNISIMANGDLTSEVPVKYLNKEDEIGVLAKSISTTQNFIRDMLNNIKDSSISIDKQSESLSAIAQDMTSASENVTTAIQDVAKGAGAQAEDLTKMIESLNHFANELDNIVHAIGDIDHNAGEISVMAEDSTNNMQSLVKSSNIINSSFKEFMMKILGFGDNVKQINEIANFINGIADQTNLLALNAAIEAARAGEAGRGFAVVADQIRKLAEQTKSSSVNINTIIKGVSDQTKTMVNTSGSLDKELDNQIMVLNTTLKSFEKIIAAIQVIAPEIEAVNSSAFQLDGEKNAIIDKIEGVASIAEEVSASSEEIAASSEEMNASMDEVASASLVLTEKTREMMKQVERFKL
ncbi:MAG: methyl-accepting chemotaxis sensory transducer with Cache sensor [Herbinix sp.]|nr:methyl-accepting chemotaxis sensory transducer with Cache sensor [Herbinix sp.]